MAEHIIGGGTTVITWTGEPALDTRLRKVAEMYDYERRQQLEPWGELWAQSARVTFPIEARPGERDVVGKDAIVAWTRQKFVERASTDIDVRAEAIAGAPRVIAHLDVLLHFENGRGIGGPLVMAFTFDDEDRIVLAEEYVNDAYFPPHYKDLATPDNG